MNIEAPSYYDPNDRLLKPRDVAAALGLHAETLYRWMRNGVVSYVLVGPETSQRRRKRIRESEMQRLMAERRASVA